MPSLSSSVRNVSCASPRRARSDAGSRPARPWRAAAQAAEARARADASGDAGGAVQGPRKSSTPTSRPRRTRKAPPPRGGDRAHLAVLGQRDDLCAHGALAQGDGRQEPELALKLLDAVVELAPDYAEGWNRRAYVHYMQSDYERAMGDLRRVLALEPNHFKALDGLAQILREIGEKKPRSRPTSNSCRCIRTGQAHSRRSTTSRARSRGAGSDGAWPARGSAAERGRAHRLSGSPTRARRSRR